MGGKWIDDDVQSQNQKDINADDRRPCGPSIAAEVLAMPVSTAYSYKSLLFSLSLKEWVSIRYLVVSTATAATSKIIALRRCSGGVGVLCQLRLASVFSSSSSMMGRIRIWFFTTLEKS
jgi:hypothetical protein